MGKIIPEHGSAFVPLRACREGSDVGCCCAWARAFVAWIIIACMGASGWPGPGRYGGALYIGCAGGDDPGTGDWGCGASDSPGGNITRIVFGVQCSAPAPVQMRDRMTAPGVRSLPTENRSLIHNP